MSKDNQSAPISCSLPSYKKFGEVLCMNLDQQQNKLYAVTREEMDWSDGNFCLRNKQPLKPRPLEICDSPECISCTVDWKMKWGTHSDSTHLDSKLHNNLHSNAEGQARKSFPDKNPFFPVLNPHGKGIQRWNKFFVISCLVVIFVDPLFFFLFSVQKENKCILLNWPLAMTISLVRCVTDFIYLLQMLLQFRLAYVDPESRMVGTGDLVDQPKKIVHHYLRGYFLLDLCVVLPLPQIMILIVIPRYLGSSTAHYAKDLLQTTVLLQYLPRIIRFVPLLASHTASGFIFESAWASFVINLLMFVLAGHVTGCCFYLFGLQRVNKCLQNACSRSHILSCKLFIDCGNGNNIERFSSIPSWQVWLNDSFSTSCFSTDGDFPYGIYGDGLRSFMQHSLLTRYLFALFWGFQQISTLAGNRMPSSFAGEIIFITAVTAVGLLFFALLIGNMQNFFLALGRRRLEMQLRRRDVEEWMRHIQLPEELKRQVRQAERFCWAATRGVNQEELLGNLPEDLQREIRRHFFKFLKKVRIFSAMDEPILDSIYEKLRHKLFIRGSYILYRGGTIEKMVFIVRGQLESIGADGTISILSEGDVCGEELLTWCLEHSSMHKDGAKIRHPKQCLFSNRMVKCVTNVEAFALRHADLEEVTAIFARSLRNPHVLGAIRYESPYWRIMAATHIQVAWRYRRRRHVGRSLSLADTSTPSTSRVLRSLSADV